MRKGQLVLINVINININQADRVLRVCCQPVEMHKLVRHLSFISWLTVWMSLLQYSLVKLVTKKILIKMLHINPKVFPTITLWLCVGQAQHCLSVSVYSGGKLALLGTVLPFCLIISIIIIGHRLIWGTFFN